MGQTDRSPASSPVRRTTFRSCLVCLALLTLAPHATAQIPPALEKTSIDSRSSGRCSYSKGRITESFELNTVWYWGMGTNVDLTPTSRYVCRLGCPTPDNHPEVLNTKGEWQGLTDKNGNPIPLNRDDLNIAKLGEILNDLVSKANSDNGLTSAVSDAKAAGCENAAFPSPGDVAKKIDKLLKEKQVKVLKKKENNIGHWVNERCFQQERNFYQYQMQLLVKVSFIRHRVVEEHGNAPVSTDTTVGEAEGSIGTATFPDLLFVDSDRENCCASEPKENKRVQVPTPTATETPKGVPHTQEKPRTVKRTPTATPTKTPSGGTERGSANGPMKTVLIGVVLPTDSRPGETVSGRVVTDPEDFEGIPALKVVKATVRVPRAHHAKTILEGLVVDAGNGRQVPVDDGFTAEVPAIGAPLSISVEMPDQPLEKTEVPVSWTSASNPAPEPRTGVFAALPIVSDSGIIVIHGAFDGNSETTLVKVNDEPARVVAESPRATFVQPDNLRSENRVVVQKGIHAASFNIAAPKMTISAPRTAINQGDETNFDVRVDLKLPESAWKAASPAELYDIAQVQREVPDFVPPSAGEDGQALLIIKNNTPEIVSMSGGRGDLAAVSLTRSDFSDGEYDYRGHLRGRQTGSFEIEARLVFFLAETPGIEQELQQSEPIANETPSPRTAATATPSPERAENGEEGDEYGDEEPPEEEIEREIEREHVLEIFSPDLKAARQALDEYEDSKEYKDAFNGTEEIERARKAGHPLSSEQIDKIWKDWEAARDKWKDLRKKFREARFAAERAYYQLPASVLKALENPLSFTPNFSGLPNADKLRRAYDYKLKKAQDAQKAEREER